MDSPALLNVPLYAIGESPEKSTHTGGGSSGSTEGAGGDRQEERKRAKNDWTSCFADVKTNSHGRSNTPGPTAWHAEKKGTFSIVDGVHLSRTFQKALSTNNIWGHVWGALLLYRCWM